MSISPSLISLSASAGILTRPTPITGILTPFLTLAILSILKPGARLYGGTSYTVARLRALPLERSIASTPASSAQLMNWIVSSTVVTFGSISSIASIRISNGISSGMFARISRITSRLKRQRFSRLWLPYSSVRLFRDGFMNSCGRYVCAPWNSSASNPASTASFADSPNCFTISWIRSTVRLSGVSVLFVLSKNSSGTNPPCQI